MRNGNLPTLRGLTQDVEITGAVAQQQRQPDNGKSGNAAWRPGSVGIESDSPPYTVIGVICAGDLAVHRDKIKQALLRGLEQRPDAVWVCIEPKSDRMTHDVMISLDIDPVVLPMNDEWRRREHYDLRRVWRDLEMLSLCDELIVFHKRASNSPWRDRIKSGLYDGRLFVVDLGKDSTKQRKPKI